MTKRPDTDGKDAAEVLQLALEELPLAGGSGPIRADFENLLFAVHLLIEAMQKHLAEHDPE
jgi:hypothetical protein